jgi:hypothetical protein
MNTLGTTLFFALVNLAVASSLVARPLAHDPAGQSREHAARTSAKRAAMCLIEPVDPPPCATPASAPRVAP